MEAQVNPLTLQMALLLRDARVELERTRSEADRMRAAVEKARYHALHSQWRAAVLYMEVAARGADPNCPVEVEAVRVELFGRVRAVA